MGPSVLPKLRLHYWGDVLTILRKTVGAEVIVTAVPGTGSIASRAQKMHEFMRERVEGMKTNSGTSGRFLGARVSDAHSKYRG